MVSAAWGPDLGGVHPTSVSCCSPFGAEEGRLGSFPLPSSSLTQVPTSTSVSMEHGHVQVGGARVSLEAVVSMVSSRAMSNQDIVPGNAGTPPSKED